MASYRPSKSLGSEPINQEQSGRLQLAKWLTNPNNPLTARVAVNRVWHQLFGRGIVSTVDNFGVNGAPPSHPELLDYLATSFIQDGWSTKRLVKRLVLSHTYRLSSDASIEQQQRDPANRLFWRHTPRRLNAEEVRDAMLATAGRLQLGYPTETPVQKLKMRELRDNGPEAKQVQDYSDNSVQRSLYLPLMRGVIPRALEVFDPVEQTLVTGQRDSTTVPSQALFLLNSAFVRTQALALAEQIVAHPGEDTQKVQVAYQRILGREPTAEELDVTLQFISDYIQSSQGTEEYTQQLIAAAQPKVAAPANKPDDANVIDPDQIIQEGVAVVEPVVWSTDQRTNAWLAFAQSLYATAEFSLCAITIQTT